MADARGEEATVEMTGGKAQHGLSNLWRVSPNRVDSVLPYPAEGYLS